MDQVSYSTSQFSPGGVSPAIHMVDPAEGMTMWVLGMLVTLKAFGTETGGSYSLFENIVPPGGGPPNHIHTKEVETWYMIEGELTWNVGNESFKATKGCFVHLPRGVPHTFINNSDKPAHMVLTCAPAGFEEWFIEVGQSVVDHKSPGEAPPLTPEAMQKAVDLAEGKYGLIFPGYAHDDKEALKEMQGSF